MNKTILWPLIMSWLCEKGGSAFSLKTYKPKRIKKDKQVSKKNIKKMNGKRARKNRGKKR